MAQKTALDKLTPINLEGPAGLLDETLLKCADRLVFPQTAAENRRNVFSAAEETNPYQKLLEKIEKIADNAQIPLQKREISAITTDGEEIRQFVTGFYDRFTALQNEMLAQKDTLEQGKNLLVHLRHLSGMTVPFDHIFSCRYIKVRFGRLPLDSEQKLQYYGERLFLFFPFSRDQSYLWSAYFTTNEFSVEVDDIFNALFFERVRIPDGVHGTPAQAQEIVQKKVQQDQAAYERLCEQFSRLMEENAARFLRFYNEVRFLLRMYDMRGYASVFSDRFYLTAFASREGLRAVEGALGQLDGVKLEILP